ncbi:MAG: hypothetical protein BGO31_20530 [Bacteroidetes bacterium 43-16]|nr:MAG: hypothetical protein BGO31_20530 [Bacteroidetes bacterium 43-16]
MYKYRYIIYSLLILSFIFLFSMLSISISNSDSTYEFDQKATKLNGVYATYEGKVYAMVPSNGYYEVKDARAETFKVLPDNFEDAHIGYDEQNVYAGNVILKDLKPGSLKALGNNYYTDGSTAYYCSRNSERNTSLNVFKEVGQLIGQRFGIAGKPQTYWYPAVKLPQSNTPYHSQPAYAIAVNDEQAFYKGLPLPEADPQQIKSVLVRQTGKEAYGSSSYFTDGQHVYYQNQLLPLTYHTQVYEQHIEGDVPSRNAYLIDEQKGMVYADGTAFDVKKAPYRLLSARLKHANQVLFAAQEGIYFYNAETGKVERAGKNPFAGNTFEEISDDVFRSSEKIYYLRAGEVWGNKSGLQSRNTHLMLLENVSASAMQSLSTGKDRYNNVWQAGNRYFYFDDLGSSQLMPHAVYAIKDATTARRLATAADLRSDDIRDLQASGKLLPEESDQVLTASTDYDNPDRKMVYWIVGGGIVLALLLFFLLRNKKIAPFLIKEEWLIMNNLSFKKYKIAEIEKVVFKVEKAYKGGYTGKMQIRQKNGKASRWMIFATRITLVPETEPALRIYVEELRAQLSAQGIRHELA